MATRHICRPGRRPLRTAAALAVAPLTALLFFVTPSQPVRANAASPAAKPPPTCNPIVNPRCPSSPDPTTTPACNPDNFFSSCSPSPTPEIVVISPVPLDSPTPAGTPSYLIGIPSPTVDPGVEHGGTPIPLAGDFNARSPGPVTAVSDNGGGGGGLPGPLVLLGVFLLVGTAGSVLLAIAPKGERFPEPPVQDNPGFAFTPYGLDSPELMVMDQGPDPSPRSRGRRSRPGS